MSRPMFLAFLLVIPILFPEAFIAWSRTLRRKLRDDIKRRVSQKEWEQIAHEFEDLP